MGSRRSVVIGVVAVAVALVVVVGAVVLAGGGDDAAGPVGAVAAVQDDHLPTEPIAGLPARLDLIADTGVTTTRVDLFWGDIAPSRPDSPRDPSDPAYDFSRSDLIMQGLAERGITPIVSVYHTPPWAAAGRMAPEGGRFNVISPDPDDFADFMAALATRYAGGFTSPGGQALPEVRRYEIWNEPNLSGFLIPQAQDEEPEDVDPAVRLDAYAAMVEAAHPAIKRANPDALVIAGVGGPRSSTSDTGVSAIDWVRGLVERDIPLDAYSQHVYPAAAPLTATTVVPSWSSIGRFLDELDAFAPGLPLYITEAGYTTAVTPYRDTAVTEDEQADYLEQIYDLPQLRSQRIRAVVWFNLQDNANWPAGLVREDLSRKPSYDRFVDVIDGQGGATLAD